LSTDPALYLTQACIAWIKHELPERKAHVYKLLRHVRLPLISREFLMSRVDTEPLVRESAECRDLLLEAMRYHLLPEQRASLASVRTAYRQPEGVRPYLFAVGGGSLFAIHSECEVYSPRSDRWSPIAPMATRRSRAAVAAVGNMIYAVGGYDGSNDLASGESYNSVLNKVEFSHFLYRKNHCW
jgi:kelch-like protein 17 (actinfilin)